MIFGEDFNEEYFKVSKMQALILANIFAMNYQGEMVDFSNLVDHLKCNPMKLLAYSDDIEALCAKGIVLKERTRHRPAVSLSNDMFFINESVTRAILNDNPLPEKKDAAGNVLDVLEKIYVLAEQRENKEIYPIDLYSMSNQIVAKYRNFPLIDKVANMMLDIEDTFLFLYLTWRTVSGSENTPLGKIGDIMFNKSVRGIMYIQKIVNKENEINKINVIV